MRVVFMGTPRFAVPILEGLLGAHDVVAVYARPDAASRRGRALVSPPTVTLAREHGVPVHQPATLRDGDTVAVLRALAPDVICVAAYGLILPREVLEIPQWGCINVHASLLPRHRGAAPIQRAILDGDQITGVSIMRMEEGLDTGPVAATAAVATDDHTTASLTEVLAALGSDALLDTLRRLESGPVDWVPQDDSAATYASKVSRDDVALRPDLPVADALVRVRASSASATSRLRLGETDIVVLAAAPSSRQVRAGRATYPPEGPVLGFLDGAVLIAQLRPAGRGAMTGAEFVRGARSDGEVPWAPL